MKISYANSFFKRLKGLLFKASIGKKEALVLYPSKQVHSFGMRFDIAVYYFDENFKLLAKEILVKNKLGKKYKKSFYILEAHPDIINEAENEAAMIKKFKEERIKDYERII